MVDQPRTNIVKDEKDDLVIDTYCILARWRNHLSQILNVHGENYVKQTVIHTAEPLVLELRAFEVMLAIERSKVTNYQVLIRY
jgi:hypothetical protein